MTQMKLSEVITGGAEQAVGTIPLPTDALREVLSFLPRAQRAPLALLNSQMAEAALFVTDSQRRKFLAVAPGKLEGYGREMDGHTRQADALLVQLQELEAQIAEERTHLEAIDMPYLSECKLVPPASSHGDIEQLGAMVSEMAGCHERMAVLVVEREVLDERYHELIADQTRGLESICRLGAEKSLNHLEQCALELAICTVEDRLWTRGVRIRQPEEASARYTIARLADPGFVALRRHLTHLADRFGLMRETELQLEGVCKEYGVLEAVRGRVQRQLDEMKVEGEQEGVGGRL